jgi:hypothetical protein
MYKQITNPYFSLFSPWFFLSKLSKTVGQILISLILLSVIFYSNTVEPYDCDFEHQIKTIFDMFKAREMQIVKLHKNEFL